MNHFTTAGFWDCYNRLPPPVRKLANGNFELLKTDPRHPSIHLKRIGKLWSARVGIGYRALAVENEDGFVWFWIGSHADYERIVAVN